MPKLKCIDPNPEFLQAREEMQLTGDNNFCSPLALAMVTGISVQEAADRLAARGRKKGKGTPQQYFVQELDDLGFKQKKLWAADFIRKFPRPHCDVLKNLTTHHPRRFPGVFDPTKTYIAEVNGHILAIVGGEVKDWSVNRSLRIWRITEIVKKESIAKCDEQEAREQVAKRLADELWTKLKK